MFTFKIRGRGDGREGKQNVCEYGTGAGGC